jgi:hypothetical protein
MSVSYYIYYQVDPRSAAAVRAAVQELQRSLQAKAGVAGRLLSRRDDPDTWMEVYEHVPDPEGFEALLAAELERLRIGELLGDARARHIEIFRPL